MYDLTDDNLVLMCRNGDAAAFDVLFDRHYRAVFNFAKMMLHDEHRAKDALQDTFVSLLHHAASYEPRGYFKTWLLRICRNRCLNLIDAERARRTVMADTPFELVDATDDSDSPSEQAEADDRTALTRQLIGNLPDRQREVIVLYAMEGMKYQEIADTLQMPINTVKTLIHRGRAAIAEAFERLGRQAGTANRKATTT